MRGRGRRDSGRAQRAAAPDSEILGHVAGGEAALGKVVGQQGADAVLAEREAVGALGQGLEQGRAVDARAVTSAPTSCTSTIFSSSVTVMPAPSPPQWRTVLAMARSGASIAAKTSGVAPTIRVMSRPWTLCAVPVMGASTMAMPCSASCSAISVDKPGGAVEQSTRTAPAFMWAASSPTVARISASPGRTRKITSLSVRPARRGVGAAPAGTRARSRSCAVTAKRPSSTRWRHIGPPMTPRPTKPIRMVRPPGARAFPPYGRRRGWAGIWAPCPARRSRAGRRRSCRSSGAGRSRSIAAGPRPPGPPAG